MIKIRCYTLFDITKTNVGRRKPNTMESTAEYVKQRNQQVNYETVIQIISLRSQPENITDPKKQKISANDTKWGSEYKDIYDNQSMWSFSFTVYQSGVFDDGVNELGNLILDCNDVPMITNLEECKSLISRLNTTVEYKNIHFEVDNNE